MYNRRKSALAVAITVSLSASAAQAEQEENSRGFDLDPIVVTSTLGSETVNESLSSVTVIDPETMDRQQPRELSQVLRGQPGINITSSGSFGKNTSVFTRGTGSESTIFLLDGIRIRSATSGGAPWQYIPPQVINRMEIARGPRGSLYGADAVGGVVQGFTTPTHDRDTRWVEAGGGSFSTHQVGGGISGMEGNTRYSLQGNYLDTDGTRIREGGEDKGFRNSSAAASVSHELANGGTLSVLGLHSRGSTEFDNGETDFVLQTLGVKGEVPITNNWVSSIQLSESRDEQDQVLDDSFFDTRTRTARLENTLSFAQNELVTGAEYLIDDVDALAGVGQGQFEEYEEDSRYNGSIFAQLTTELGPLGLQFNGRWDDNEFYGEEFTGSVAAGYQLDRSHRVRTSYGTAFRAPTFNDLYYPGFGNPELEPESSATTEIGFRGQYDLSYWDLAIYQTDVEDLILLAENIGRARIRGAELTGGVSLDNWDLRAMATVQDPRDRRTDDRLQNRSVHSIRTDVDYSKGPVFWGVSGVIEGNRYADQENEERISGYATADLRVGAHVTDKLLVRFTMENVFNRQYSPNRNTFNDFDYLAAGRTVFASVRYGAQ